MRDDGRASLLRCAAAAAVAAALYLPTLRFDFAYDDAIVVAAHPQVTAHAWRAIAVSPYHVGSDVRVPTGIYRPLTIASFAANHLATGLRPWSYHAANVLLAALGAALVVLLGEALRLGGVASLAGGLAFAVHPVHVEAVANVAGRAELLATAAGLGALVVYARSRGPGGEFTAGTAAAMTALLAAALFSKENAVTLLGVIVLWELLQRRPPREAALPVAAAAAATAVYLGARYAVLGAFGLSPGMVTPVENPIAGLTGLPRAATVLAVFGRAVALVVTPVRLSPDYGAAEIVPSRSLLEPAPLVGALLLAALLAAIAFTWRRAPAVALLLGAALGTYAIVSNAFVLIGTILGDRLLYLPSAFACLLFGLGIAALARSTSRRLAYGVAAVLLVALAARAFAYAPRWRNDATLFEYAARVAPDSVRALGGWAEILAERGRLDEARPLLDRAVALAPDFIPNRLNRAAAALLSGDLATAESDARHVLALEPDNAVAARHLAAVTARR